MHPLNNQIYSFDHLPGSIMGHVLEQLTFVTGRKEILNQADIPVLMRYAYRLIYTSKTMSIKVNAHDVMGMFLNAIRQKYEKPCEHFPDLLTMDARKWIWNNIQRNGDAKNYQVIQDIHTIVASVLQEAKNEGHAFKILCISKDPSPFNLCKIKQGFVLNITPSSGFIDTPLGTIKIFELNNCAPYTSISLLEVLVKRLNAIFTDTQNSDQIYEIESSQSEKIRTIKDKDVTLISGEKIPSKVGTPNLIITSSGISQYKIRKVNEMVLPEVVRFENHQFRKFRTTHSILTIWEMLEANRLGQDPTARPQKVKKAEVCPIALFNNISEASDWAIEAVNQQPSGNLRFLLKSLNLAALKKESRLYDSLSLKEAYDSALHRFSQNWIRAELKDHPTQLNSKSEEDYVLYVTKEHHIRYKDLTKFLIDHLGLSKSISYNPWGESSKYLWIKRVGLGDTLAALNIS